MATVNPSVAATQLFTIVQTLYNYNYVNSTTDPVKFVEAVNFVVSSGKQMLFIANSTGLTLQDVNRTLTQVYVCMNGTLATSKNYLDAWKCIQFPTQTEPDPLTYCTNLKHNMDSLHLGILCFISVIFLFFWSFTGKRKSCCLNCCYGFPRPVVPLNMLDSYENRLSYAAAYGATTIYCITVLFDSAKAVLGAQWGKIIDAAPGYISIFFKIAATAVIALAAYPLFTCVTTSHKVAGSIFGLFYSLTWFGLSCWTEAVYLSACLGTVKVAGTLTFVLITWVPQCFFFGILAFKFAYTLFVAVRKRQGKWLQNATKVHQNFENEYLFHHVKNLLKCVPSDVDPPMKETIKIKIKKKLYKWEPEFKYSVRIVCVFVMSAVAIYYVTVSVLFFTWYYLESLIGEWVNSSSFATTISSLVQNNVKIIRELRTHFRIATICLYVAVSLAFVKTCLVFGNMLSLYRRHMMRLRKGDRSWLPSSVRTLSSSPSSLLAASMKFAGFQVAYAAWGYGIFVLVIWIVFAIAVSLILHPLFNGQTNFLLKLISKIWPAALISLVVNFAQLLAAKFCFLQQRGAIISIDNRRAFHIVSYLLFFFNIFLGLFSCLLRIIKGMVIGVLFLERVQKSILPRSFEPKDPGYYAYIGYILTEHSHANPVLSVFFYLLGNSVTKTEKVLVNSTVSSVGLTRHDTLEAENGLEMKNKLFSGKVVSRWKIVRNRWNLAYTLVNNPSLVKYRKGQIEENDVDEDQEALEEKKSIPEEKIEVTTPVQV